MKGEQRTYRNWVEANDLSHYRIVVKETDVFIHAPKALESIARERIIKARCDIEAYIAQFPKFATTLEPWNQNGFSPAIVRDMAEAGRKAGVGPMAAVAGAIAEYVGKGLLDHTNEVIVENGGDIFVNAQKELTIGIFAGNSPFSSKIRMKFPPVSKPFAVCTSSGTVGHSLSYGKADAVCIVSESCALADAAATSVGNRVKSKSDIKPAIEYGKQIEGVKGILVIIGDQIGAWGEVELV